MDEETSENKIEEEEEEVTEIEPEPEIEEYELIEEPETTKITRSTQIEGKDYCPFCRSVNIGKDFKQNIYMCLECGRTYLVK